MKDLIVRYRDLDRRRRELGMSYRVLAELSGVSLPVVQRLLAARIRSPRFENVMAIADALGNGAARIQADGTCAFEFPTSAEALRESQARGKARRLVAMVQGTSALEGQAVGDAAYNSMIKRTYHELLAGSCHRLWSN
jgi:transcriptional regulator with XRE-family HTH domain